MTLANFFAKAALAATQVARGLEVRALEDRLNGSLVAVAFDDSAARTGEGRATLGLAVNLLARLYPRLALVSEGTAAGELARELGAQAAAINPQLEIGSDLAACTVCLAVGETAVRADAPTVYVGSNGWVAHLSPDAPVGCRDTANPFGAGAAACFGAANVFRRLFAEYLPNGAPDTAFSLSLLDYERYRPAAPNPALEIIDVGETFLVGIGAIGSATVWALSRVEGLRGTLHLVDHEQVDLSNLQRYVLTTQESVGMSKAALARAAFHGEGLDLRPHAQQWGAYLQERNDWQLERVAVALDSAEDRMGVQAALPRWIANAWTQPLNLGVSRHGLLGEDACLMCLYLPDRATRNHDELVAEAIGLPEAVREVREMLAVNTPLVRPFLERIARALQVPLDPLLQFEGRPLQIFYAEGMCGGIVLQLKGRQHDGQPEVAVPMAFQSALAGLLLAAEVVTHAAGLRSSAVPVMTTIDLLRPLAPYLSFPEPKHPSGRCICQDRDYQAAYQHKYGPARA